MKSSLLRGRSIGALLGAVLLFGLVQPAIAFGPVNQNELYEIQLPRFDVYTQTPAMTAGTMQVASTLLSRYGSPWNVYAWNPQSGTPRWVYGHSVKVSDAIQDEAQVDRLARQAIAQNGDVLRADGSELRLTATPHVGNKWAAHYQQTWHGYDVIGATVRVVFSEDGRMMLMGSDYYSNIDLSPVAVVTQGQAIDIARNALPFNAGTDRVLDGTALYVLPYPLSASDVEYHLVYRVKVQTEDPIGIWNTLVDAHDGKILSRINDIDFAYSGTTFAPIYQYGYCDQTINDVLPYLTLTVSGVGSTTTDILGNWSINGTGGARAVTANLTGPYVDVTNSGGARAVFNGTAQENVPLTVTFNDANSQMDERVVFSSISDIHKYYLGFDPSFGYVNARITARVRVPGTCNAYWDGSINFYAQGGGCANTGEMKQVVYHEFCHGITNSILGGQGVNGIGEGNSDILGNLLTQDHIIGRGFYLGNCTSGIRDSQNTLRFPQDLHGEVHWDGQIIAGFNWDAMVGLKAAMGDSIGIWYSGKIWHQGRTLLHPQDQPDQVLATFTADDDNGTLDDGTPNYDILCQAATNHNFSCPEILVGVFITTTPLPYTGRTSGYQAEANIVSLPQGEGNIVSSSVKIFYRVNGGSFNQVGMNLTAPDTYSGTIPGQAYGSVVEYYLQASNDLGDTKTSPRDAPAHLYYFQVNSTFPDAFETPTAWTSGANGDNAATGLWIDADPVGSLTLGGAVAQPEDDHTPAPGTMCWVTGNANPGDPASTADVDGGKTTLLSPGFDLFGASQAQVSYWKYYTNDQGNHPEAEDYWDVDVTNDGGQTWSSLEHTVQSTHPDWVQMSFDLMPYLQDPQKHILQMRFIAQDLPPNNSLVEALVDDFLLAAVFNTEGADGNFDVKLTSLAQNTPNPFNPITKITFRLAQSGPVTLAVYDAAGRQVRSLVSGSQTAGEHQVTWNGMDDSGRPVATGTYFCRFQAGEKNYSTRMVLLK